MDLAVVVSAQLGRRSIAAAPFATGRTLLSARSYGLQLKPSREHTAVRLANKLSLQSHEQNKRLRCIAEKRHQVPVLKIEMMLNGFCFIDVWLCQVENTTSSVASSVDQVRPFHC